MIFFTAFFIALVLRYFICGQMFFETLSKIVRYNIDHFRAETSIEKDLIEKKIACEVIPLFLFSLFLILLQFWYISYAYTIDIYVYPSLFIFIACLVFVFVSKSATIKSEEDCKRLEELLAKRKKYEIKMVITSSLWLIYLLYILAIQLKIIV